MLRLALCLTIYLSLSVSGAHAQSFHLTLHITDAAGAPLLCRVHLSDAAGKPVRVPNLPFFTDHVSCPGAIEANLPAGKYSCEVERGPEYERAAADIDLSNGDRRIDISLDRIADLPAEGWWPGDMHVHRKLADIELLMRAEDLHIAPVITWWNDKNPWAESPAPADILRRFDDNRFYDVMGGEDERGGGALLYFGLPQPLDITQAKREFPSPVTYLREARRHPSAWVDVEKPFWWDVPTWIATGQIDSIGLANNHMCRSKMYESEAWGRPRDVTRLPPPRGTAFWTQEIYYHLLNTGLRIPPSAGSASGVLPNPVGYNRVYVHTGPDLTWDAWWSGLRAGRSFVTNGPLLRCTANGQLPGATLQPAAGATAPLQISLDIHLTSNDPIHQLEVIRDGEVLQTIPADPASTDQHLTARFSCDHTGWFLIRAIADVPHTFRFASTAPFYVQIGDATPRISRHSVQFFLDWVQERMKQIALDDPSQQAEVLAPHEAAVKFWTERLQRANAE